MLAAMIEIHVGNTEKEQIALAGVRGASGRIPGSENF